MDQICINSMKPSIVYIDGSLIESLRVDSDFYHSQYINNEKSLINSGLNVVKLVEVISKMNSPIGWQGIPSAAYLPTGIGIPLIRVQNVSDLMLDKDSLIGVQEYIYQEQPAIQADADDIIITRVGTIGRVCRIPHNIDKIAMGQNLTRIKVNSNIISSEYLTIYMSTEFCQLQMKRYAYGGVQPSLTNRNIKELLIPIPSKEFQEYIGCKIRMAEGLRDDALKLKKEAEDLLESWLKFDLFLEKAEEIKEKNIWISNKTLLNRMDSGYYSPTVMSYKKMLKELKIPLVSIGEISKRIRTGTTPKENFLTRNRQKLIFLRMTNIDNFIINMDDILYVNDEFTEKKLKVIEQDDLLVSIAGTIGRATVMEMQNCTINQNTASITVNDKDKYNPYYLALLLNSNIGKILLERVCSQATIKFINNDVLSQVEVPVLPIEVQNVIEEKIKLYIQKFNLSKSVIQQAKQDIEDLIEGTFDMSKLNDTSTEGRC